MAGTSVGGREAAGTIKSKFGEDFYSKIGAEGGRASGTGGFYADRELARTAGALGGRRSRRNLTLEQRVEAGRIMRAGKRKAHRKHIIDNLLRRIHARV